MREPTTPLSNDVPNEYGGLEEIFLRAVKAHSHGDTVTAEREFRSILDKDPRLPEPRLELAIMYYRKGSLEDAEHQARFAIEQIEQGWQWLDNFSNAQLESYACTVLGEILLTRASDLEDAGGVALWREAESLYRRALKLDPENGDARSSLNGFKKRRS